MDLLDEILPFYKKAVRTAIVALDRVTNEWYHIFSVIELLPEDILPYNIPDQQWYQNRTMRATVSGNRDLYRLSIVVEELANVHLAIEYFKNPISQGKTVGISDNFFNNRFSKEPSGTSPLVLSYNTYTREGIGAILPKRNSGLLVWAQIDIDRVVQNKFMQTTGKELDAISELTTKWLGFDLPSFPEHLGNIYLSLPNPYFRKLDFTYQPDPSGIIYKMHHRKGFENQPLSIQITDWHGDDIAFDWVFENAGKIGLLKLPHEPGRIETKVYNPNRHLIAVLPKAAFLKGFNFNLSVGHSKFEINKKDEAPVFIQKFSSEQAIQIGEVGEIDETYYFKAGEESRLYQEQQARNEFHFFAAGQSEFEKAETKAKARKVVKEIINQAKDSCYLVDPYFTAKDLVEYAIQIQNISTDLRILNCRGSKFVDKTRAEELLKEIEKYNKLPYQKIVCRMLKGSFLHDRFIVTDTRAFFLGTSFSEIGERATCIGKIPNSSDRQVVNQIEKWFWDDTFSQTLEDYIKTSEA